MFYPIVLELKYTLHKMNVIIKILKQILSYSIWGIIAVLLGVVYMKLVLEKENSGFIEELRELHITTVIAGITLLLYIILDISYLKKKLNNSIKAVIIRLMCLLIITIIVGVNYRVLDRFLS